MDRIARLLELADSIAMTEDKRVVFVKSIRNAKSVPDAIKPDLLNFIERALMRQHEQNIAASGEHVHIGALAPA